MSFSASINRNRNLIVPVIHSSIVSALQRTWQYCQGQGNKPYEPDLVAGLVIYAVPDIYSGLSFLLKQMGYSISMTSVFCHQTPRAKHSSASRACELGDLLFVFVHQSAAGQTSYNALLGQVKMSSQQPYSVPTNEYHQLELYTGWPDFTYSHAGRLNGKQRQVTPKCRHRGAQYLLIDDRSPADPRSGYLGVPGTYPIGVCMPDTSLYDHSDLANEIVELMLFRSGRPFKDYQQSKSESDWSTVVWDLLHSSLNKAFNCKRSGHKNAQRVSGAPVSDYDGIGFAQKSSPYTTNLVSQVLGDRKAKLLFENQYDYVDSGSANELGDTFDNEGIPVIILETSESLEE